MDTKRRPTPAENLSRAQRSIRAQHVEATAFLYAIVETANRLRTARSFDGEPAFRFDAQWSLLRAIERCGGAPSFSDLARMLRVTRQSARAQVLAAEKAGVVELFPDADDRRALQVALTRRGRQTLESHRMPAAVWIFTLLNGLERKALRSTDHVLRVIGLRLERYENEMKRAAAKRRGDLR
jgi:DNA-binding MarR family transcriptional regulator